MGFCKLCLVCFYFTGGNIFPDGLALVMGKARYDGENGVEPSKNFLTISFLLPLNQIPFSFYSLPCLGGLYG